jgi:hypothetical protein
MAKAKPYTEPDSPLRRYCDGLIVLLQSKGHRVAHGSDFKNVDQLKDRDLQSRVRKHHEIALAYYRQGVTQPLSLLGDVQRGGGAYCCRETKTLVVPDEKGLLDKFAAAHRLNRDRLAADGITDLHLYAEYLIHEASHVIGNDGPAFTPSSHLNGEFQVHALAAARFIKAADTAETRNAIRLFAAAKYMNPFNMAESHIWSMNATDWALARVNRPGTWRADGGGFASSVFNRFARHGDPHSAWTAEKPLELAQGVIGQYGMLPISGLKTDPRLRYAMRDAALNAADDLKRKMQARRGTKRDPDLFQAYLLLRQMGRSLDTVLRYADDYYPRGAIKDPPRLPKSILDMKFEL